MTPASARSLRRRRVAELRAAEPHLSLRQMADRLGISRDTVTRDLEAIDRKAAASAPPAETGPALAAEDLPAAEALADPVDDPAPQVSADSQAERVPPADTLAALVAEDRPPAGPAADLPGRPAGTVSATLPRRVRPETELVIDLAGWPALRRDLAVVAQTGLSPQALINQAVVVLAFGYKQGVRTGAIHPDRPFRVLDMTVGPHTIAAPHGPAPA